MWMIIYILAIPVFSFAIPLYSFWHGDDFSWGSTRVVMGDNGKKQVISSDTEKFDPSLIPTQKWATYEHDLLLSAQIQMEDTKDNEMATAGFSMTSPSLHLPEYSIDKTASIRVGTGIAEGGLVQNIRTSMRPHSVAFPELSTVYTLPGASQPPALTSGFVTSPVENGGGLINRRPQSMVVSRPGSTVILHNTINQGGTLPSSPTTSTTSSTASSGLNPSDAMLMTGIRGILSSADLMSITKKQVRDELSILLGNVDLRARRETINQMITLVLSEMQ